MDKKNIKQYADDTYEYVSSWINNCDSKASILLALIGVVLSIAFTSDYILDGIKDLVKDVIALFKGESATCVCASIILLLVLGFSIGFFIDSIRRLLQVLLARFDDSRDKDNPSIIFYRSIGAKTYEDYKERVEDIKEDDFIDDKLRQVHDCSKICTSKFLCYNEGLNSMKVGLVLFAIYFFLFIIKSSL